MAQHRRTDISSSEQRSLKAQLSAVVVLALLLVLSMWRLCLGTGQAEAPAITIGLLYSQSGTMAADTAPMADAIRFAVEEINARGGIDGSPVEIKIGDGRSDPDLFAAEAERLITQEHAAALFGCWTSACRKAVKTVVERHDHLLFYPLQYEGLEQSPNIVYLGESPNQQIIPATSWALRNLGKRLYLVGSDYVFPRIANAVIRRQAELLGGTVVGEEYRPLADQNFGAIARDIVQTRPDAILNTVNGDSNLAFFAALREAGIAPDKLPVLSFSVAEGQTVGQLPGDYAAWSYFQSLPNQPTATSWRRSAAVTASNGKSPPPWKPLRRRQTVVRRPWPGWAT
ncbi:transporter substrate-binding protein, partial [Methylogaea oryzae]|uniref:transporter substrate-binding protein n=1 Tax=Methylogaea oryzae TaxID=1295382 RepID=UPI0012E15F7A